MELENYKYEKVKLKNSEQDENLPVSYLKLYKFSTNFDKVLLVVAVFMGVVTGVCEALFYINSGRCIEAIANFGNDLFNAANNTEKLKVETILQHRANEFAIFTGILGLTIFIATYISTSLFNYTAMKQVFKIRELYFFKVLNQDIPWHDKVSTGDFASRIVDDLQKIQDGINDKAAMAVSHAGLIVAGIAQSLIVAWKLTLAFLVLLPFSFVMMFFIGKLSTKLSKDESEAYGGAAKVADETLTYIKTVIAYNGQREETKRYHNLLLVAMKNNIKKYFFIGLTNGVTNSFLSFGMALGLWYGARLIIQGREGDGEYGVAEIIVVYTSTLTAVFYIGALTPILAIFNTAKGAATKIFGVIDSQPFINKSYKKGIEITKLKGNIGFKDVGFSYPARPEVEILKNFNLEIKSGETVALVGGSGCGKSTIIQLIQRFYDVDHGQICLDGNEITTLNLKNVRDHIGMVGQEPVLFDGTIADNIKLGKLDATQAEVEEAAKKSNAHSFITSFPNRYQTVIGERGTQLSGGQKQRIAIARALIRKPAILLLDEATSALDSKSESVVQATLDEVSKDCTTIIVAHRLSTIRQANRIVVLENGSVVEEGSHDELMLAKGNYHNLVVTQLSDNDEGWSNTSKHDETIETIKEHEETIITPKEDEAKQKVDLKFFTAVKILNTNLSEKWYMIAGVICSIAHIFGKTISMYFLGKGLAIMANVDAEYVISKANLYSVYIIIGGLIVGISLVFQSYFIGIAGEHLAVNLKSSMFKSIVRQDMGWFDRSENGVGSLSARLAGEPSKIQNAISVCAGTLITAVSAALSLLVVGVYLSWRLFFSSLCFIPFLIFLLYLEHKVLVEEIRKNSEVLQQSIKLAVEAISNVRTVASLTVEKTFHSLYMLKLKSYKSVTVRNIHIQSVVYGLTKSGILLANVIPLYYGIHLIKKNEADAATVIVITNLSVMFLWLITYSLLHFTNTIKGFVACNQINELLSRTPEMKLSSKTQVEETPLIIEDIRYSNVSFSYPTRPDTKVLDGFDLSVLKGKTVALVGPSGCGKSTVIQLLERFYDSNSGFITFGDKNIYEENLNTLRFRLGIVMQEPNLFSRTIAENIAYGNVDAKVPKAEIIQAAQKANIHNFITGLPLGYETVLGEKGTQLSGGQKQRIAIARALVRNPEVLLLDEATSALDAESEKIVQEALNNAKEERTCIVIAHRLKTVIDSDLLVVLDKGKVAEQGTHQELMNLQGLYWNLYNLQQQQQQQQQL